MTGRLVLVATPLGNMADLSPRAIAALAEADAIACEDTRTTRKLLSHAGVRTPTLLAVHEHNEASMVAPVLERLRRGETVALVSDAGLPAIADPGERIVRAAADAGFAVSVVPGPTAFAAALAVSGLPTGRFAFEGFLPRKGADRARRLAAVASDRQTVVLYEAPHRLRATLADLVASCGPLRRVVLVRELTKLHEEVWRGTLEDALGAAAEPRGEYVIVLEGAPPAPPVGDEVIESSLADALARGTARRDAVSAVAASLGVPRGRVYDASLRLRAESRAGPPAPPGTVDGWPGST